MFDLSHPLVIRCLLLLFTLPIVLSQKDRCCGDSALWGLKTRIQNACCQSHPEKLSATTSRQAPSSLLHGCLVLQLLLGQRLQMWLSADVVTNLCEELSCDVMQLVMHVGLMRILQRDSSGHLLPRKAFHAHN